MSAFLRRDHYHKTLHPHRFSEYPILTDVTEGQKKNKNIHFTISFIYCRVYDRIVHVGRRFIVKMTTVYRIQLIHLFIERGNCRHKARAYALAYKCEKVIHSEHGCVRYRDTSFQGVSR